MPVGRPRPYGSGRSLHWKKTRRRCRGNDVAFTSAPPWCTVPFGVHSRRLRRLGLAGLAELGAVSLGVSQLRSRRRHAKALISEAAGFGGEHEGTTEK
jgi:hypothetical protein